MIGYLMVIGAAFVISSASMPLLRSLSFRIGAVAYPDARRMHTHAHAGAWAVPGSWRASWWVSPSPG